ESITIDGVTPIGIFSSSGIFSQVGAFGGSGNAGDLNITTPTLSLINGGQINTNSSGSNDSGDITINAKESVVVNGVNSSFFDFDDIDVIINGMDSSVFDFSNEIITIEYELSDTAIPSTILSTIATSVDETGVGKGGQVNITTPNLFVIDGGQINAISSGQGNGGDILIQADALNLDNGSISTANDPSIPIPTNEALRSGGNIDLQIKDYLTLDNESTISARAGRNASGGSVDIDAEFIIAHPSGGNGNDILASAEQGRGGKITINAESLFNIEERQALLNNETNDIDATSQTEGLDGTVSVFTPDINTLQTESNLPNSIIESEQTVAQACQRAQASDKPSGLTIKGKGGIPPAPTEPLDSETILVDEQIINTNLKAQHLDIKPIKTSIGDIYPARGIIKTEDGNIILTSYPTDNNNTRTPHNSANCTSS
ncbi:MAG: filamentous hemagglutinin, partial [Cyanobacteria bacterium P01_F01_bin.143]